MELSQDIVRDLTIRTMADKMYQSEADQKREEVAGTFDAMWIIAIPFLLLWLITQKNIFRIIGLFFVVMMFIILIYETFFLKAKDTDKEKFMKDCVKKCYEDAYPADGTPVNYAADPCGNIKNDCEKKWGDTSLSESKLLTESEKDTILNFPDVNGIGTGIYMNDPNKIGILIGMVKKNNVTENKIKAMLGTRPYKIDIVGENKPL